MGLLCAWEATSVLSTQLRLIEKKNSTMFAVVKFLDESDAPGIVCTHWISEDKNTCLYPNVRTNEARDKLLRRLADPDLDWSFCRIEILHMYSSFSVAYQHLQLAEETSNLENEEEILCRPRKRVRTSLMYPGEDSDDNSSFLISEKKTRNNLIPYPEPPQNPTSSQIFHHASSPESSNSAGPSQLGKPATRHLDKLAACSSSQNILNGKIVAWMADISLKVSQLQSKVDEIFDNQEKILNHFKSEHNKEEIYESNINVSMLGSLPVNDDDAFMKLNRNISEDNHFRQLFMKVLVSVGGKDMRCYIHNMLRKILSDEVAELYNVTGKSNLQNSIKKPFISTEVSKTIFSVCQRLFKEVATEVNIKGAVADWLNQAKVRKLRRMQRHGKKIVCEIALSSVKAEKDVE